MIPKSKDHVCTAPLANHKGSPETGRDPKPQLSSGGVQSPAEGLEQPHAGDGVWGCPGKQLERRGSGMRDRLGSGVPVPGLAGVSVDAPARMQREQLDGTQGNGEGVEEGAVGC